MDAASTELLNIGNGSETSVLEIFRLLADATGYEGAPVHGDPRPEDLRRIALSYERAVAELGWRPEVSLAEGLAATVEHLRSEP
jgi:UDP-glucose 4-epimerase